ncbi:hypothetical protein NKI38_19115 [Mesorhizobium sp. M0621]|uniref:hypothetical protein n=1 Tax=Mesorhizobium sp. M0621 TaxID=2956974 RepID=UPI003338DE99
MSVGFPAGAIWHSENEKAASLGGRFVWISYPWPIGTAHHAAHSQGMMAEYVELALLEQSLANTGGIQRPFFDRVGDVAEKTAGSVLFDIRVDDDSYIQRMAAIGYGANGTVAIMMDKNGQLSSAPVNEDNDLLVAELAAWYASPLGEQVSVDYRGTAVILIAKLRTRDT